MVLRAGLGFIVPQVRAWPEEEDAAGILERLHINSRFRYIGEKMTDDRTPEG